MTGNNTPLDGITPFIFGTTRLGDKELPRPERLTVAQRAMQSGAWFHTARMYGEALEVLGEAFHLQPRKVPKLIIKIGWEDVNQLQGSIQECLKPLGVPGVQLGQLCLSGKLAEDFAAGGVCYQVFRDLKQKGLVSGYVVEIFPWTSAAPLKALRAGYTEGIIDGYIFYLNPLQRFASNALWEEIVAADLPVIAMRTVSGGPVLSLRDVPGFAWKEYLQKRAVEVAPIFERSGIKSWTEFCLRYAHSLPQVRATVGSSGHLDHLDEFLKVKPPYKPLPAELLKEIDALQTRWSDELDMQAKPWTM